MAITCMIVDDRPEAVDLVTSHIEDIPDFTLVFATRNPLEALQYLQQNVVDVVFLDINMPKLSGMELLRLTKGRSKFVFTTAHTEYALDGYEHGVIDYLVKPITFERFLGAVQKIRVFFPVQPQAVTPVATPAPRATPPADDFIMVKTEVKGKMVKVVISDIKYVEGLKNYLSIYTRSDDRVITMLTIKDIEDKLPANQFVRVHRSYIVALSEIVSIEGGEIRTSDGSIPLGNTYREAFFELIKDRIVSKKTDS